MRKVIGVTGGIASGKSTVSKMIMEKGYTVIDADLASRAVVEPGEEAYRQIVEFFGAGILREDGTLNREKLGNIIFNDKEKRLKLNSIVHPAVRRFMDESKERAFSDGETVVFLDIPLLFESKLTKMVDCTLLVYVNEEVQLKRLMRRNGYSEAEALSRIRSQMPLDEKKQLADAILDNNGSESETKRQLEELFQKWDLNKTS